MTQVQPAFGRDRDAPHVLFCDMRRPLCLSRGKHDGRARGIRREDAGSWRAAGIGCRARSARGERWPSPGRRQSSCGSSSLIVLRPTRIASACARSRCARRTRLFARHPRRRTGTGPRCVHPRSPPASRSRAGASLAPAGCGRDPPSGLLRRIHSGKRRYRLRLSNAIPRPETRVSGSSVATTTRASPAFTTASAHGGVLP